MADAAKQGVRTNRELALERLASKYPDRNFEDDEALFGQFNEDYADYDKQLEEYQGREKALSDMFTADPRNAVLFQKMKDGEDPVLYLIREYGPEVRDALDDPKLQDQIEEAGKDYASRLAESKKYDEEYGANVQETLKTIAAFQEAHGLSDEEIDAIMDFLVGIVHDGILGLFKTETLAMAAKALNHDTDVEAAGQEGEVRGKNAKIQETLRKGRKGDGMAHLDGQNGSGAEPQERKLDLGALGRFDGQSIWGRGGEKRRKY